MSQEQFARRVAGHVGALVLAVGLATALATPSLAGSGGSAAPPFPQLVRIAQRITLAEVTSARGAGAYVLTIERVYKGQAPNQITFPPDDKAVSLSPGSRVLLLQMDRRYLDFRGTYVWLVGPDGRLSDAKVPEQPSTVAAFDAFFGLPATDLAAAPSASVSRDGGLLSELVPLSGLAAFGIVFVSLRRRQRTTCAIRRPPTDASRQTRGY